MVGGHVFCQGTIPRVYTYVRSCGMIYCNSNFYESDYFVKNMTKIPTFFSTQAVFVYITYLILPDTSKKKLHINSTQTKNKNFQHTQDSHVHF